MLASACFALTSVVLLLALAQACAVFGYLRMMRRYRPVQVADDDLPKALVILTLRGGDEELDNCLAQLANQDYPRYQVKIVIDHPTDPARAIVERFVARQPNRNISFEFLHGPSPCATLKCSGVRQALRSAPRSVGAVVLVDGDANPYPRWLRDLVTPLHLPGVGAVTGNRWYFADHPSLGTWVRAIYNGMSLPVMRSFGMAWEGSLALPSELAFSPVFDELLGHAPCEASAVHVGLAEQRLRLHFNPRVLISNTETIDLGGCFHFLSRQLLWMRLHHPAWLLVLAYTLFNYLLFAGSFLLGGAMLAMEGHRGLGALLLGAIGGYVAVVATSILAMDRTVRDTAFSHQGLTDARPPAMRSLTRIVTAAPAALIVYTFSLVHAWWSRAVVWRGVKYRVVPPHGVQVVAYRPLADDVDQFEPEPFLRSA